MDKMFAYPRPVSAVVSYSQQKSKWIMEKKMVGWDAGNVKKLGAGAETVKAAFIDRRPTLEDREKAIAKVSNNECKLRCDGGGSSCSGSGCRQKKITTLL